MGAANEIKLHVHIAAFGQKGIDRVAAHRHPRVENVRWLVSLQCPDEDVTVPEELISRSDFDFIFHKDRGLAKNRNHALRYPSDSEYILIADDDVDYDADALVKLIEAFEENKEIDLICARYRNKGKYVKNYGDNVFNVKKPPFGWYPSAIEIAFRRNKLGKILFNENFGIGAERLLAGEDSIFFNSLLRNGFRGICIPLDLCEHNADATGIRMKTQPQFLKSYGACMTRIKPVTWFPRLILHAYRTPMPFCKCLYYTFAGVVYAYWHGVFREKNWVRE